MKSPYVPLAALLVFVAARSAEGVGLTGEYFDNADLTAPKLSRVDQTVDFNWSSLSPATAIGPDTFSVRWTGQVLAPVSGTYFFSTRSDDGVQLWVDGQLVLSNWTSRKVTQNNSGKISLIAGRRYDLKLEYFENTGNALVSLSWRIPGTNGTAVIPSANLFPTNCSANCSGKQCGDDGCGGSCGTCGTGLSCDASNQCVAPPCTPSCSGKQCGDDGCGGSCGTCGTGLSCNVSNQCVAPPCTPSCSGKQCGDDGCGGSCGTCGTGLSCNVSNQCVAPPCTPSCSGKQCGDDGCGGSCGTCGTGLSCNVSNQCVAPPCTPNCSGKQCGDDGCGGSCGTCGTGLSCNASNQCVAPPCTPSCSGSQCGPDGCGGVCGTCGSEFTCSLTGQCTPVIVSPPRWFRFAAEITGAIPEPWADNLQSKLGFNAFGFWAPFASATTNWISSKTYSQMAWMPAVNRNLPNYYYTYDPVKFAAHENTLRTLTQQSSDPYKIYWDGMPEWDASGGDWGQGRPNVTSSLTRQQNYDQFKNYYLNTLGLANTLGIPRSQRGYNFAAVSDYPWTAHWVLEWGADLVMGQRIIDELSGIAPGNCFYRGAAKQFGKSWGSDMSTWRYWTDSPTEYDSNDRLTGGWSASWFKRHLYTSYMGGANLIHMEPANYFNPNTGAPNPLGVVVQQFANFALTRHPNRPPEHVPFALIVDKYCGFDPKFGQYIQANYTWYSKLPYTPGDFMLNNFFRVAYPDHNLHGTLVAGGPQSVSEYRARLAAGEDPRPWEPMSKSRWGDVFDVLHNATTTAAVLANYKIAMLTTDVQVDSALRAQLQQFVQNGGTLILNASQVTSADTVLTGAALTGQTGQSNNSTWTADGTSSSEPTYTYDRLSLQGATVVATNSVGDPLITRYNVGAGQVYLTTPTLLQDSARSQLLNIGQKLIGTLLDQVAPVKVQGANILYLINTDGQTTTVTLVNGLGTTWSGNLSFPTPSGTFKTTEWSSDTAVSNSVSGGMVNVSVSVPPYEVRVYALERTDG